jgi:cell division protein FtsI (penicillin-binding protein 3)
MWELYTRLGFGQRPQIEAPAAASGRLRPYKSWRPVEQATMSYGYGLSASIVQLARAYTAFGTDGEVVPLTLIASDTRAQGVRVLSPKVAEEMRTMLGMATKKGGTAPAAQPQGYSVGGKTGTARKQVGKNYVEGKYRTFFVGLAPINDPRVVVAVMIDEPSTGQYYAGLVAAPAFASIVENVLRSMGVAPDLPVKPDLSVAAVEESN